MRLRQSYFSNLQAVMGSTACMLVLIMGASANAQDTPNSHSYNGQTISYSQSGSTTIETRIDEKSVSPERVLKYTVDDKYRIIAADGPRNDVSDKVSIEWQNNGQRKVVTNALEHETVYDYDANQQLSSVTNPNGRKTVFAYDNNGFLASYTTAYETPFAATTQLSADITGRFKEIILPSGRTLTIAPDESGANSIEVRQILETIYAARQDDPLTGLLMKSKGQDRQALPRRLAKEIPLEDRNYDSDRRLISFQDAAGGVTSFSYDQYGNLKEVSDPRGVTTSYKTDGFGQLIKEKTAERGVTRYQYDAAGNLTKETREGGLIIKRNYDALNRLTKEIYKQNGVDRKVNSYTYDDCENGIGRLCRVASNSHVTRYSYNILGKYTRVATTHEVDGASEVSQYGYGQNGRLETIKYPTDLVVRYLYNDEGTVSKVTGRYGEDDDAEKFVIATNIEIDPVLDHLEKITFGNGIRDIYRYDADNQLKKITTRNNGQITDKSVYTRNAQGIITSIQRLDAQASQGFSYDSGDRLTYEQIGSDASNTTSTAYGYDNASNRLSRDDTRYDYRVDANQLSGINRKTPEFDERGNLIFDRNGKRAFEYDVTNRLTSYYNKGSLRATYEYNAFGQRIRKTLHRPPEAGDTYRQLNFTYTPDGWLLSEIGRKSDKSKTFTDEYVWLGNRPIAKITRKVNANGTTKQAEIIYLHTDHLATPRNATSESGETVWSWQSDAFGNTKAVRDPDGDGNNTSVLLRFPGQYYDKESGLHYNHHRDYDPSLGRYIQPDPIGLWGGINRYGYVSGNPVNFIDPLGLAQCTGTRIKRDVCPSYLNVSSTVTTCDLWENQDSNGNWLGGGTWSCSSNSNLFGGGGFGGGGGGGYVPGYEPPTPEDDLVSYAGLGKCPSIVGLELDAQSQRDLQQIMEAPNRLRMLQIFASIGAVVDISNSGPADVVLVAFTGETWSQWAGAVGSLTPFAINRIETLAGLASFRYDYSTPQSRKHKQFWEAIANGCLTR